MLDSSQINGFHFGKPGFSTAVLAAFRTAMVRKNAQYKLARIHHGVCLSWNRIWSG
jgi:hypothetical protein